LAHAAFNLYPEPWAAAWQALPPDQRGLYPVLLITIVEAVITLLVLRFGEPRRINHNTNPI
jgi:hypothetical protein